MFSLLAYSGKEVYQQCQKRVDFISIFILRPSFCHGKIPPVIYQQHDDLYTGLLSP
jgi:hypothetical protein